MAAAIDSLTEMFGVPVNDDGGEEVQPGHSEVLAHMLTIANESEFLFDKVDAL